MEQESNSIEYLKAIKEPKKSTSKAYWKRLKERSARVYDEFTYGQTLRLILHRLAFPLTFCKNQGSSECNQPEGGEYTENDHSKQPNEVRCLRSDNQLGESII